VDEDAGDLTFDDAGEDRAHLAELLVSVHMDATVCGCNLRR
jgi:hypothetical protein